MLDDNVSPAADQPDSQAVGQPLVTWCPARSLTATTQWAEQKTSRCPGYFQHIHFWMWVGLIILPIPWINLETRD
eukprot:1154354-Pelagomonas_calceolata.AAC.1